MAITTGELSIFIRISLLLKKYILGNPFNLTPAKVSSKIRSVVCEFQHLTTDYQFKLSQAHKKFKSTDDTDAHKHEYFDQLEKLSNSGFKSHAYVLANKLKDYFIETRHLQIEPRIGIYLFPDKGNSAINILNDTKKKMVDYTIFLDLKDGNPYLDNCIPKNAKRTDYKHAGMNQLRRENYCYRYILDSKFASNFINSWKKRPKMEKAWVSISEEKGAKTFYKSHIAVPITFKHHGNLLDPHFSKMINLQNNGKAILGFILVDHERPYYFDDNDTSALDNIDVNVLYVFADILSLSFVTKLTYYDKSETVSNHLKPINKNNVRYTRKGKNVSN